MRRHGGRTAALAGLLCLIWGLAFVVQKIGLERVEPLWFAAGRALIAAAALGVALALHGGSRRAIGALGRREHALSVGLGATNITAFLGLQIVGLDLLHEAGAAAAIIFVQPLLTLLGAALLLGEPLTRRKLLGGLAGFSGVALVGLRQLSLGSGTGVVVLLGSAAAWAAGTLLLKTVSDRPAVPLIALQHLYGGLPLLALAVLLEPPPAPSVTGSTTLLYAGVVASAGGWLIWTALLARGEAGVAATYLFWIPLVGAAGGIVVLGEPATLSLAAGAVLVAVGARIGATGGRARARTRTPPPAMRA